MPSLNTKLASAPNTQTNYVLKATSSTTIGNSLIFDNGTFVGINTTNPSYQIDVAGAGRFTTGLYFNNSATNGAVVWQSANESLRFATNDTERMRISASGNVGIGATPTDFGSSYTVLDVYNGTIGGYLLARSPNVTGQISVDNNTAMYVQTRTNHPILFAPNNTERMRITSSGNVGIGTSSPGTRLDVVGTTRTTGTFNAFDGTRDVYLNPAADFGLGALPAVQVASNHGLQFATNNGLAMFITAGRNVGIGATNPDGKLEVAGNIKMSGTANAAFFGSIQASWSGSTAYPTLFGANADRWVMHINPHVSYVQNGVNGYTGTTYGAMVRMAADPAANNYWDMGILSVFGGDRWGISRNTTGLASLTSAGVWSTNGGGTSDARVKQNIEYIETSGLDAIQALKPVKFEFIENPEKKRRGFIAQDVLEVIPDLVLGDGEREGGTYGLDYDGILALAVKAIQELNQKVTQQQEQINQLINK